ncbi:MAG: NAD-dependent epimerase/dehydratase family protein [Sedimentisphaeraceae bacterium JB056]
MADNKIALITGAAGFIGLHTVKRFVSEGWFVYAVIHRRQSSRLDELQHQGKVLIFKSDVTDFEELKQLFEKLPEKISAVVHCAGRASDIGRAKEFRTTNFDSVRYLGELVSSYDIPRFVFVSTTDVYGMRDFHGEDESQLDYAARPINNYPKYKILAEKCIKDNMAPEKWCILRPAAVWGCDDPTMTKRLRDFFASSPFIIHFGKWKGQNRWPAVHVDSVADACYLGAVADEAAGEEINVIDTEKISVDQFYRRIIKQYFPDKKFYKICLPFWVGWCAGAVVSGISNLFNLSTPIADPSLYAAYSVSSNLDFSGQKLLRIKKRYENRRNAH